VPLAYLNRVGGQDELVFDGASFVVNGDGSLAVQMKDWEEQEVLTAGPRPPRAGAVTGVRLSHRPSIPKTSIARWFWRCVIM
jgi:hypothetical protein